MSETILRGSLQNGNERLHGTIHGIDALNGSLQNESKEIKGALLNPEKIYGKSAYEVAVMHGFVGTEEEWLESLGGATKEEVATIAEEVVSDAIKGIAQKVEALEKWMNDETYTDMTASLSVSPSGSKEYGDSVTNAKLTWEVDKAASSITLTLPNGSTVDLSKMTSPYEDTNKYIITADKTWKLNATRADGNKETKSPTAKISRQYRVYWGLGTQEDGFDSDFVKSLKPQGTTLTTSRSRTLNFSSANNQYVYYVIPTALGTPAFQIGEFPIAGGFESGVKIPVDTGFTDDNGNPIKLDYNLYRSSNLLTNNEAFNVYVT